MEYNNYMKARVNTELVKSFQEQAQKEISKRENELRSIKAKRLLLKSKKISNRTISKIDKAIGKRQLSRSVVKSSPRASVVVNQPVYLQDRNRFFKDTWEEENKRLFFD